MLVQLGKHSSGSLLQDTSHLPLWRRRSIASSCLMLTCFWFPSSTESASWTTESFSSWEGWGPSDSYYPPEDSSSWSSDSTEGGVCPPYTVNSSTTSSEEPEKTTLVTTRTVTITTVTTETYSTADVEEPSSTAADAVYPVPSWTRCPHANDVFSCGDHGEEHGAADAAAVLGMRSEGDDDPEEGESSEDDLDLPEETEVVLSAAGSSHTEAIRSSGWLVALVLIVPVGTAF